MGAFQRRHYPLYLTQQRKCTECFLVCSVSILNPIHILVKTMLRSYRRVIKTCGYRMGNLYLTILILQKVCLCALKDADRTRSKPCGMFTCLNTKSSCLKSDHFYSRVINKR